MRVLLAENAGFCPGVEQAIRKAKFYSIKHRFVWTDGALVHNAQMIQKLKEWNICELSEGAPKPQQGVILIRAHGVSPQRRECLKCQGIPVKDATCPEVTKIAENIQLHKKDNRWIFIFGNPKHAETIGLQGYAGEHCTVFPNLDTAKQFAGTEQPCCLVSQSTQSVETYSQVADVLTQKCPNLIIEDTICLATKHRQQDIDRLIEAGVEAIIVVGSVVSGNTQQLAALSRARKMPTFLAETIENLDLPLIKKSFKFVGLTAGASTPPWIWQEVHTTLLQM